MQVEPELESRLRPAAFGLVRGLAILVMALAFVTWALVLAAKVPCRCDGSLTVRGAAMPWLSVGLVLMSAATFLLITTRGQRLLPRAAAAAGWASIVAAYLAFLARRPGVTFQLGLVATGGLVFTFGVAAMIWTSVSKRMAAFFGVVLGASIVIVAVVIQTRV